MGMSVIGLSPISDRGKHFYCNVWVWRPLWRYCEEIAPDIIPADNLGYCNDGWVLDSPGTLALADRLERALASGGTQRYEETYRKRLEALPPEACTRCGGTGRLAEPSKAEPQRCLRCDGKGTVPNFEANYSFSVENVRRFTAFLQDCGSFAIC
jgi:hypothetical protein